MTPWPIIPADVVDWFREVFSEANRRTCERLVNVPNIRETSLDDGFIESLIPDTAPHLLLSGAIVRMDAHNIGGLRRLGWPPWDFPNPQRWETADIAILVFVYRKETLVAKKIGLLQSKRLYPKNNDVEDADELGFRLGMNAFIRKDGIQAIGALHRNFDFDADCTYGAIQASSEQTKSIDTLNSKFGSIIYYLLYNPHVLPLRISYPIVERIRVQKTQIGCRVVEASKVHAALAGIGDNQSPSFQKILDTSNGGNWPLETWAADLLLTCKVGQQFDDSRDQDVNYFLERRSGPIGAALAVSIVLPD